MQGEGPGARTDQRVLADHLCAHNNVGGASSQGFVLVGVDPGLELGQRLDPLNVGVGHQRNGHWQQDRHTQHGKTQVPRTQATELTAVVGQGDHQADQQHHQARPRVGLGHAGQQQDAAGDPEQAL
ncbi:hypothetical protein D3C79_697060 [compost metagenome]